MSKNDPMNYNFEMLKERVLDTLNLTNLNSKLKKIKGNTICIGSGGSKVVAAFASLVLNAKNNCSVKILDPRDTLYENLNAYDNLFICSYSGNNHGVNIFKNLKIKKYLLTYNHEENSSFKNLICKNSINKELSFISLGATLMPMSLLLQYYLNKDISSLIEEMFEKIKKETFNIKNSILPFELLSGNDTITPQIYLDSTFIESGLNNITLHSKYDYCHGRSTLSYHQKSNLIYLLSEKKELDDLLLENLNNEYNDVILLESNYKDKIVNNFYLTLKSMYLTMHLSKKKNIDLSIVNYNKELCKKLYKYNGNM